MCLLKIATGRIIYTNLLFVRRSSAIEEVFCHWEVNPSLPNPSSWSDYKRNGANRWDPPTSYARLPAPNPNTQLRLCLPHSSSSLFLSLSLSPLKSVPWWGSHRIGRARSTTRRAGRLCTEDELQPLELCSIFGMRTRGLLASQESP